MVRILGKCAHCRWGATFNGCCCAKYFCPSAFVVNSTCGLILAQATAKSRTNFRPHTCCSVNPCDVTKSFILRSSIKGLWGSNPRGGFAGRSPSSSSLLRNGCPLLRYRTMANRTFSRTQPAVLQEPICILFLLALLTGLKRGLALARRGPRPRRVASRAGRLLRLHGLSEG